MSKQVKSISKSTVSKTQHGDLAGTRLLAAARRGPAKSKTQDSQESLIQPSTLKKAGRPASKSKDRSMTYADVVKGISREFDSSNPLSDDVPFPTSDMASGVASSAQATGPSVTTDLNVTSGGEPAMTTTEEELFGEEDNQRLNATAANDFLRAVGQEKRQEAAKLKRTSRTTKPKPRKSSVLDAENASHVQLDTDANLSTSTPVKKARRGGSNKEDPDTSSGYGSADRLLRTASVHGMDQQLQGNLQHSSGGNDDYVASDVYDTSSLHYQGSLEHNPLVWERECLLRCCEERCGHLVCSRAPAWRGTSKDMAMWGPTVVPDWWHFSQAEVLHLQQDSEPWVLVAGEPWKLNHEGLLRPRWICEMVRGCCLDPCLHGLCAASPSWKRPTGQGNRPELISEAPIWHDAGMGAVKEMYSNMRKENPELDLLLNHLLDLEADPREPHQLHKYEHVNHPHQCSKCLRRGHSSQECPSPRSTMEGNRQRREAETDGGAARSS